MKFRATHIRLLPKVVAIMDMDKIKAESEIDYRVAMLVVDYLIKQGILSDEDAKAVRDILIDDIQPFIGRLERGL